MYKSLLFAGELVSIVVRCTIGLSDVDPDELLYGSGSGNPPYESGSGRIRIQGKTSHKIQFFQIL